MSESMAPQVSTPQPTSDVSRETSAPTVAVNVAITGDTSTTYQVPFTKYTTVLDALDWLQAGPLPTLAYRASCRSGICGSCGVMVNGRPVLACETFVSGFRKSGITIAPLARFPVLRDLIVDVAPFIAALRAAQTWQLPVIADNVSKSDDDTTITYTNHSDGVPDYVDQPIRRQTPAELAQYRLLSQCINCLLCYAACPQFDATYANGVTADEKSRTENPSVEKSNDIVNPAESGAFVGPAAIALAQRWSLDSRDNGAAERFTALSESESGIWACTQDGNCTLVCPKGLDPKAIIGELQRRALDL